MSNNIIYGATTLSIIAGNSLDIALINEKGIYESESQICLHTPNYSKLFSLSMKILGATPNNYNSKLYNVVWKPLSCIFSLWIFFGWFINFFYVFFLGRKMPPIPGWYEISLTTGLGVSTGLILCTIILFSVFFTRRILRIRFIEYLSMFLEKNFTLEEFKSNINKQTLIIIILSLLVSIGGIIANFTSEKMQELYRTSNIIFVIIDISMTIISYILGFMYLFFGSSIVYLTASAHRFEVTQLLTLVKSGSLSSEEFINKHIQLKKNIREGAKNIDKFFLIYTILPSITLIIFIISNITEELQIDQFFRLYYIFIFFIPTIYGWLSGCKLFSWIDQLFLTLSESDSKDFKGSCQMTQLYSYLMVWRMSGPRAFSVLGIDINFSTFARISYIILSSIIFLFQKMY